MAGYVIRRVGMGVLTLLGATMLVFLLMNVLPGDVVRISLGGEYGGAAVDEKTLNKIRHDLGLDRPLAVQYVDWLRKLVTGKMGYSYAEKSDVGPLIGRRISPTMHLGIQAVVFSWLFGLPLGIISALRRNSVVDYASRLFSVAGLSMPSFWVALMVTWVLATRFNYFPPLGYEPLWRNPWVSLQQTLAPSLVLGFVLMAYIARLTRASLLEVLQEDYVRTARAKGLRERLVITRHALKIALLPTLTLSAVQLGVVLGGTVVIEQVFNINGIGRMVILSVFQRDIPVVQNVVLLLAGVFVVVNLLTDLLYGWLDPRIRHV